MLIKNIRTGDLAFNRADSSLWGVQHHNGLSRLVRIEPPYTDWDHLRTVLTLAYGKDLFDIDVSPDGAWLTASMIEVNGRQRLIRMDIAALLAGDSSYEVLYEFADNSPANFVFSPDGTYLYGTSYYTGVSNVFRYDFATGEMEALTNALTGFFRPVPVSDDQMIAFHYTADGFVPVRLDVARSRTSNRALPRAGDRQRPPDRQGVDAATAVGGGSRSPRAGDRPLPGHQASGLFLVVPDRSRSTATGRPPAPASTSWIRSDSPAWT